MFNFFFGGKAGDLIAPRPVPNKEIWALLKAGLLDKALVELRKPKSGINVNEVDESKGMTLLHVTCAQGAMELVVELLSQGADIAVYSTDGNNCLHYAAKNDRKGIVEILLRSGADPSIPNKAGILPVELSNDASVRELFLRDRSTIFSPIVQTRMLLSDYIEQLSLSPQPATKAVDKSSTQVVADVADNVALSTELNAEKQACTPTSSTEHPPSSASAGATGLSTVTEGSEENVSRKTVFNMADELDEAESPERSELLLTIPPESHSSTDDDGYLVGVSTPAPFARQYSALDNPSRSDRPSSNSSTSNSNNAPTAGGDYTIVGVSSVKKPMKKSMNTRIEDYSSGDNSSDIGRHGHSSHKAHTHIAAHGGEDQRLFFDNDSFGPSGGSPSKLSNSNLNHNNTNKIPKLNLGGLNSLAPPPTDVDYNANPGYLSGGSNPLNSARSGIAPPAVTHASGGSRNNSINFYVPTSTTPGAAPVQGMLLTTPRSDREWQPSLASVSQEAIITPTNTSSGMHLSSTQDAFDIEQRLQDDNELRQAVLQAAAQTAQAMQCNRDDYEARRLMVRNCQKLNEAHMRKLLTFDPSLAMSRTTEMNNLAVDGQTILHVAASFGNVEALKIMVEKGKDVSLWVRDLQGRTPLHVAAQKGQQDCCVYLREAMKLEKQRDPVGEDAPTDLAGTTPLGWATIGCKGKPKTPNMIKHLFSPGDRSILPRTPVSTRAGKSPWKAPATAGYDKVVRENIVFAFSEAHGWTPGMEDRILVSCPVTGRPAWSLFGVCDGHGGTFCSEYLANAIPTMLAKEAAMLARYMGSAFKPGGTSGDTDTTPHQLKELLLKVCVDADTQLSEHPRMFVEHTGTTRIKYTCMDGSGSTAILALVTAQYVAVANVGDSRAVLAVRPAAAINAALNSLHNPFPSTPRTEAQESSQGRSDGTPEGRAMDGAEGFSFSAGGPESVLDAVGLSRDHKVSIPEEKERAEKAGAIVEQVREASEGRETVYQLYTPACDVKLRMTRSFGDFYLKQNKELPYEEQAVIAVPEVLIHTRTARDAFLVLACDGIWDVMTNQEVVDFMGEKLGYTAYGGPVGGVSTQSVAAACDALLQLCLERGTVDNISVILIVLGAPVPLVVHQQSSSLASSRSTPATTPSATMTEALTAAALTTPSRPSARRPSHTSGANAARSARRDAEDETEIDLPTFDVQQKPLGGSLHEIYSLVEADKGGMGGLDSPLNTAASSSRVRKQLSFTNP